MATAPALADPHPHTDSGLSVGGTAAEPAPALTWIPWPPSAASQILLPRGESKHCFHGGRRLLVSTWRKALFKTDGLAGRDLGENLLEMRSPLFKTWGACCLQGPFHRGLAQLRAHAGVCPGVHKPWRRGFRDLRGGRRPGGACVQGLGVTSVRTKARAVAETSQAVGQRLLGDSSFRELREQR